MYNDADIEMAELVNQANERDNVTGEGVSDRECQSLTDALTGAIDHSIEFGLDSSTSDMLTQILWDYPCMRPTSSQLDEITWTAWGRRRSVM